MMDEIIKSLDLTEYQRGYIDGYAIGHNEGYEDAKKHRGIDKIMYCCIFLYILFCIYAYFYITGK